MANNFFTRYIDDEYLAEHNELTESVKFKKSKGFFNIWLFYWRKHIVKSSLVIFFILLVSILSVFNIFIARQLTALLVAETMSNSLTDYGMVADIIEGILDQNGVNMDPDMKEMLEKFLQFPGMEITPNILNAVIHENFFNYITIGQDGIARAEFFFFEIKKMDWIWILLSCIFFIIIFMYTAYVFCGSISEDANTNLKNKLVKSLMKKNVEFFNNNSQGKITEAIVKDCKNIADQLKVAPIIIVFIIFSTIGSIGMLTYIDVIISMLMFALILLTLLITLLVVMLIAKPVKKSMQVRSKHDSMITEKISLIRLVKSSGSWDREIKNNNIETAKSNKINKKLNLAISVIPGIIIGAMGCLTLSSMVFGVFIFQDNTQKLITVFSSFTAGIFVVVIPIFQLNTILQSISATNKSSQNIGEIISDENKIKKIAFPKYIKNNIIEKIEFDNVSFGYPSNPDELVIKNLDLVLEKGKSYAFVGPSGSGKSTITRLIMRFYEEFSGQIRINGNQELREIDLKNWMDNIGYVDQEPQIISSTVFENLIYVNESASRDDVIDACKRAKIHELIMNLPNGYDTYLHEKGKQLSGGQKQRMVIARMFLKDPSLIILDEATSALDNLVEKEISIELEKLIKGKTTIAIAHRLSTIKNYDQIFVIDKNKKIVQSGTFDELIKIPGLFKELYEVGKVMK